MTIKGLNGTVVDLFIEFIFYKYMTCGGGEFSDFLEIWFNFGSK